MTEDDFNSVAWRDFIVFASEQKEAIDAFNAETGHRYRDPTHNPTDTELAEEIEAFVKWVTENHWGVDSAPLLFQRKYYHNGV